MDKIQIQKSELRQAEIQMLKVHAEVTRLKWLRRQSLDKSTKVGYTGKIVKLTTDLLEGA